MFKNTAAKFMVFAFDATTNVPKTGDGANITAYVSKDYGTVTVLADTTATEMDATNAPGYYLFDAAQGETNADCLMVSAKSSTSNIKVIGAPAVIYTRPTTGWLAPATAGRTLVVDASGLADANVVKVGPTGSGTAQTARDIGASVLLSAGTGTGQLDFTSGVVKANATQWLGGTIPAVNVTGVPLVDLKYTLGTISPATAGSVRADSVTGAVGSVTGAVGSVTGAVGSVTGNVGGNVTGSVGSVATGGIAAASFAAGAINAAAIAADAIGASELAADAVAEIADQVWDEVLSGHLTAGTTGAALNASGSAGDPWSTALPGAYGAGTAGKIIGDNINATISSVKAKTDNLPSSPAAVSDIPTAIQNADTLLNRDMSTGTDSGSTTVRTPRQALRFLRNKWDLAAGTLTVKKEDDSTTSWTATVTTDAAAVPVIGSDPAG